MFSPRFRLSAFGWADPEWLCPIIAAMVDAVALSNELLIERWDLPSVYDDGIEWRDPVGKDDTFFDALEVHESGFGDCDALAACRIAELRHAGKPAEPYVTHSQRRRANGRVVVTYHIMLLGPYGIEDPSRMLGMP